MIFVLKVPFYWRVVDYFMIPLMWILCGCRDLQESHLWHFQKFDCPLVPESKGITIEGSEEKDHPLFIHLPILGGWKKYVVIEAQNFENYWYVGWKKNQLDKKKETCHIHKLKIYNSQIRLLVWPKKFRITVFGFNEKGEIIPVKKVGEGIIGDNKFPKVRLF